jgi:hypothetical protein
MSELQRALEDDIAIRRTMGFKFEHSAKLLRDFVDRLERTGRR